MAKKPNANIESAQTSARNKSESQKKETISWPTRIALEVYNKFIAYRKKGKSAAYRKERRERLTVAGIFLTAIFTFITAIIFYHQLSEMQKAYGPLKDSAAALVNGNAPILYVWNIALFAEPIDPNNPIKTKALPEKSIIAINMRNYGKTATRLIGEQVGWNISRTLPVKPVYRPRQSDNQFITVDGPNQGRSAIFDSTPIVLSTDERAQIEKADNNGTHIWIYGVISFYGLLNEPMEAGFAFISDNTSKELTFISAELADIPRGYIFGPRLKQHNGGHVSGDHAD